jgi:geranylgeranyl reductase family protein
MTAGARTHDLIVVGAGPAGSAAAIAALRESPDARVLIVDRASLGRDKVCGDGIAPHAADELDALGVEGVLPSEIVPSVRLVSPSGHGNSAVTGAPGYVVPRKTFDERLLRAAMSLGAEFRVEKVTSVTQDGDSAVVNDLWRAPIVIGADGANSVVRRALGQPGNRGAALAVAIRGYAPTPAGHPRELLLRWDSQRNGGLCYAWAFPTAHGTSNVGYGMSSAGQHGGRAQLETRMRALLPEFDLDDIALSGHTLPLTIQRPRLFVGRVLLTGDAASLINPFTGEGIYSAIASGALAGRAAISSPDGTGRVYARGLMARFGRQYRQSRMLYPLINSAGVLDTIVRACEADRRMFDRLLEVGLGDRAFSARDLLRFGRHMRRRAARSVVVG